MRYSVSTEGMKKGFYRIVDTKTGETIQTLESRQVAEEIARSKNRTKENSMVKVSYKYDPEFAEIYLNHWYDIDPQSYNLAHKECNEVGNDMITWHQNHDPKLFERIYQDSLKEKSETIMDRRLNP